MADETESVQQQRLATDPGPTIGSRGSFSSISRMARDAWHHVSVGDWPTVSDRVREAEEMTRRRHSNFVFAGVEVREVRGIPPDTIEFHFHANHRPPYLYRARLRADEIDEAVALAVDQVRRTQYTPAIWMGMATPHFEALRVRAQRLAHVGPDTTAVQREVSHAHALLAEHMANSLIYGDTPVHVAIDENTRHERFTSALLTDPIPTPRNRRRSPMEEGTKVHLTTRDGYKKTVRLPGAIGTMIAIPEQVRGAAATGGLTNPSIVRRDFRVTRKAVYTDLRSGASTEEYWAVEQ